MELNTGFNDLLGCPLSFHNLQVYPFGRPVEAANSATSVRTNHFLTPNLLRPAGGK